MQKYIPEEEKNGRKDPTATPIESNRGHYFQLNEMDPLGQTVTEILRLIQRKAAEIQRQNIPVL